MIGWLARLRNFNDLETGGERPEKSLCTFLTKKINALPYVVRLLLVHVPQRNVLAIEKMHIDGKNST